MRSIIRRETLSARPSLRLREDDDGHSDINLFAGLDDEEYARVVSVSELRAYKVGQDVFRQGDRHEGIVVLLSGEVRTYYVGPTGKEITLAYWSPGNFVGGPELFGGGTHVWSGQASLPTQGLRIGGDDLRRLMLDIPRLAVAMVEALAHKGKCYSALVHMLGTRSAAERLVQLLLLLSDLDGVRTERGVRIRRTLTQEDLSKMVGATRQWVTAMMERLRGQGLIEGGGNRLVLVDEPGLRKIAGVP